MATNAKAGVVPEADVFGVVGAGKTTASPAFWSYVWVAVAALVILGFHIRLFGVPVPPSARFPT